MTNENDLYYSDADIDEMLDKLSDVKDSSINAEASWIPDYYKMKNALEEAGVDLVSIIELQPNEYKNKITFYDLIDEINDYSRQRTLALKHCEGVLKDIHKDLKVLNDVQRSIDTNLMISNLLKMCDAGFISERKLEEKLSEFFDGDLFVFI